jgi:hypothetical protein
LAPKNIEENADHNRGAATQEEPKEYTREEAEREAGCDELEDAASS